MIADFSFLHVVLAVHIAAVVAAFGVTFAYPIIYAVIGRADPRALPAMHRAELALSRRLVNPGLLVVVLAGAYLASKSHQWGSFFVLWGVGVALLIGALVGSLLIPAEKRAIELIDRDVAAAGGGEVVAGDEYRATVRRLVLVGGGTSSLVLVTILFMATQLGGS